MSAKAINARLKAIDTYIADVELSTAKGSDFDLKSIFAKQFGKGDKSQEKAAPAVAKHGHPFFIWFFDYSELLPNFADMINEEEFEKIWEQTKARDERLEEAWNALPPEEKERRRKEFDDGFYERISDDPTGDHD